MVCRGVVDGIDAVIHRTRMPTGERKVAQMVRVRDYDVQNNRWVIEPIWPVQPAAVQPIVSSRTSGASRKPSRNSAKRSRRRKR